MTSLYALYRQSNQETFNSSPLVLGLFRTVSDAQEQLARTYGGEAPWRPPRPGHRRWELRTARHLYIVEEFPVHETDHATMQGAAPSSTVSDGATVTAESIRQLMSHVNECLEESAAAARESHDNWMQQSSSDDVENLRRLQGNERYYLGQAAAFAWIAGCLDRLVDDSGSESQAGQDGMDEKRPQGFSTSVVRATA